MRDTYKPVINLRRKVFTEVAKLAYEGGDYSRIEELPYNILPGENATYRESIFLERAIIGERLRLAIGLPVRKASEHALLSKGIEESAIASKYYDQPLVNIIKFACHGCPTKSYLVTNACEGCLAHPCQNVCPRDAIKFVDGKSFIEQDKCIKCGRCEIECPYNAIIKRDRPCVKACGMDAINNDENGKANIDYDKCVSCGMCIVNCPFGAIADKSQIFQLIHSLKQKDRVIAIVAPAFVGQFGSNVTPHNFTDAMKQLGFDSVVEVAIGADLCTIEEAHDFLENVPNKLKFMATSCCPSWSMMAKKMFPELKQNISMALTPMVLTARLQKKEHKNCKVVFIGPCSAKKLEASRESVRSDVDFVLTYEELMGMFEAKNIDLMNLNENKVKYESTKAGRGFAVSGGVASAVVDSIKEINPQREVLIQAAQGLHDCKKLLQLAKTGKYDGYLLEGMACPGGCVGGAGTLQQPNKAAVMVNRYKEEALEKNATDSKYAITLGLLD